ncbi:MAG: DUF4382 domain-containing protein [Candidatus Marsarchaeota archaeon]|nr:DUF4382 domain-containing protein [Candidatus Marsarchaeota archaeon]MCL5413115.1 DUF4382 domain-containing protein [Candidatus Marsarchaeota archaeon]
MSNNKGLIYAAAVLVALVAIAVIIISTTISTTNGAVNTAPASVNVSFVPISITDPPHVPNGTSALMLSYSSLQAHVSGTSSSEWYGSNTSGTLNLLKLVNVTQTIAGVNLPSNSVVDQVRFTITSAQITVNGTVYNVTVPSGQVSAHILGAQRLNASSGILMDFTPTVVAVYTANSTVFVLVPSVRAVVVPSIRASEHVGNKSSLSAAARSSLDRVAMNITLSNVTLNSNANITTFAFNLTNNGNQSVVIHNVLLKGQESAQVLLNENVSEGASVNASSSDHGNISANASGDPIASAHSNASISVQGSAHVNLPANEYSTNVHVSGVENASSSAIPNAAKNANASSHASASGVLHAAVNLSVLDKSKLELEHFGVLNFLIASNGTVFLPAISSEVESGSGFTLAAGEHHNFEFSGKIILADGHLTVSLVPGKNYEVYLIGEEALSASTNVTAG